jgi:predicted NAD/FAD-binding protein
MSVAVVGAGISGLVAAYLLQEDHDITVFEANDYAGGHTHTIPVGGQNGRLAVDTGFIVYNEVTYPNFTRLLDRLGVATQPSNMSFAVRCDRSGLEYCSSSLNHLFAQRRNLFRPSHYQMIRDIRRFGLDFPRILSTVDEQLTLGEYARERRYSTAFIERFLVPMGSAIWSADPVRLREFPIRRFVEFFDNHRFMQWRDQCPWRVIEGGSWKYVEALTSSFRDRIRLSCPVASIRRHPERVELQTRDGETMTFDEVIIAAHSDQALAMLSDATDQEMETLGAIPYQENDTVLHTDTRMLPRSRRAWASWNYQIPEETQRTVAITYNMNKLQTLDAKETYCVTLNCTDALDPERIILRQTYHHPVYRPAALAAQRRHDAISGVRRTHYCGAYWGYGFHEDGVNSALAVCRRFGKTLS